MPAAQASADLRPLYEIIYGVLREHLIDGKFPPGLVLGEAGVARAFKSSRSRLQPHCRGSGTKD